MRGYSNKLGLDIIYKITRIKSLVLVIRVYTRKKNNEEDHDHVGRRFRHGVTDYG